MTGEPPPRPLVEPGLVSELLFLGCTRGGTGRSRSDSGSRGEKSCPSISSASPENGLTPRWWVTGWKVWWTPACARRWCTVPGFQSEHPGSQTTSSMGSPSKSSSTIVPPRCVPAATSEKVVKRPPPPAQARSARPRRSVGRPGSARPGAARNPRTAPPAGCWWPSGAPPGRRDPRCTACGRQPRHRAPGPSARSCVWLEPPPRAGSRGFPVELDRSAVPVQRAPGLDVRAVDGHRR
jgi:hypothetical protein